MIFTESERNRDRDVLSFWKLNVYMEQVFWEMIECCGKASNLLLFANDTALVSDTDKMLQSGV